MSQNDTSGLLDALRISKADVLGSSMGGVHRSTIHDIISDKVDNLIYMPRDMVVRMIGQPPLK